MQLQITFTRSGDCIKATPINREFVEWYVRQAGTHGNAYHNRQPTGQETFKASGMLVHRQINELNICLGKVNKVMKAKAKGLRKQVNMAKGKRGRDQISDLREEKERQSRELEAQIANLMAEQLELQATADETVEELSAHVTLEAGLYLVAGAERKVFDVTEGKDFYGLG